MGLAIYYDDPHIVAPEKVRFKVAVPVAQGTRLMSKGQAGVEELPGCEVAFIEVRTPNVNPEGVYSRLNTWVNQNRYHIAGAPREVYWGEITSPAK